MSKSKEISKPEPIQVQMEQKENPITSFRNALASWATTRLSYLGGLRNSFFQAVGISGDGTRDYNRVFGYKSDDVFNLQAWYQQKDLARRIVDAYPDACWTPDIRITDDPDSEDPTPWELDLQMLMRDHQLINRWARADKCLGYSEYVTIFLNIADGMDPIKPITPSSSGTNRELLNVRQFAQYNAGIRKYIQDQQNPLNGFPEIYDFITGGTENHSKRRGGNTVGYTSNPDRTQFSAHHSRVIHIAEGLTDNEIFGQPRLRPVFNRLQDLDKVLASSGESAWIAARNSLVLLLDAEENGISDLENQLNTADNTKDAELAKDLRDFANQLKDTLVTEGRDVKNVGQQPVNCKPIVEALLLIISGASKIPQRILTGSERGELASSQDESNWASSIASRRTEFCEPQIIRPTIDRLIDLGVIAEPADGEYEVVFPQIGSVSLKDRASSANQMGNAIKNYIASDGELLMPKKQFVEEILGMEFQEKEVEAYVQEAEEKAELEKEEMKEMMEQNQNGSGNENENGEDAGNGNEGGPADKPNGDTSK